MNPQDSNVNGEIAENPIASPAETTPPEESSDVNPQGASTTNPEEVAWNSLKGGTQDRIKQLIQERDQERAEKARLEQFVQYQTQSGYQPQTQQNPGQPQPEVRDALRKLEEVGVATDAKVDAKINEKMGNLIYSMEMQRLESTHHGDNGAPKFDRAEYEDFVNKNPKYRGYDPEDVYKYHMYPDEIADALNNKSSNSGRSTTSSLKPTKTVVREEQWTPDWIETRMKQSDGLQWYAKNKEKINSFLQSQHSVL